MKHVKSLKIIVLLIILIISASIVFKHMPQNRFTFISNEDSQINDAVYNLAQILNKKTLNNKNLSKNIDIYTANFETSHTPQIKNKHHLNLLWLGSSAGLNLSFIKDYDYIFTSTPDLESYLSSQNIKNTYLPLFSPISQNFSACAANPDNSSCYVAVIGNQPEAIKYLEKSGYAYQTAPNLTADTVKKLSKELSNLSAVIINQTQYHNSSLDISPFILTLIDAKIPILIKNVYIEDDTLNKEQNLLLPRLFADTISYYTYPTDIANFFDNLSVRNQKAEQAKFILENFYSPESSAETILNTIISNTKDTPPANITTIISPTFPAFYSHGDYWIAKDIEQSLNNKTSHAFTMFPNSLLQDQSEVTIFLRGGIAVTKNQIQPDRVFLYYLLFPFLKDETNIPPLEEYVSSLTKEMKNADKIITASPKITAKLKEQGFDAYYIPQATDTSKFYPDFNKDLKSEVLFVGANLPYRIAAQTVKKAGLPVTIYGPGWNGLATAEYIDNRILRKYYSSAKIVLNDTRTSMKQYGFIINRIFDVTACNTLIISDYMKEIEEIYGDAIPMYKTPEELINLVKYYLSPEHEAARKEKAQKAYEITLKNFTTEITTPQFQEIIKNTKTEKNIK